MIFKENHIYLSHYHGFAIEGLAIRRLMINEPKASAEIATFMKASLGLDPPVWLLMTRLKKCEVLIDSCIFYWIFHLILSTISRAENIIVVKWVS